MSKTKEEKMFLIPMCEGCMNKCKKYVCLALRSSFENKDAELRCNRYAKEKEKGSKGGKS